MPQAMICRHTLAKEYALRVFFYLKLRHPPILSFHEWQIITRSGTKGLKRSATWFLVLQFLNQKKFSMLRGLTYRLQSIEVSLQIRSLMKVSSFFIWRLNRFAESFMFELIHSYISCRGGIYVSASLRPSIKRRSLSCPNVVRLCFPRPKSPRHF